MPDDFPPFGTPSRPRWPLRVALTVCAVAALGVLAKRDHDQQARVEGQQARIDGLTQEIAALSDLLRNDARQPPAPVPCTLDSRQIAAIEQAAVAARSEVGVAPPAVASSTPPAQSANRVELDDQQEAALARANDVLAAALRRRTLTGDDVTTLHRELAAVGPSDETRELRRKIVVAVNRGELVPDGPQFVP